MQTTASYVKQLWKCQLTSLITKFVIKRRKPRDQKIKKGQKYHFWYLFHTSVPHESPITPTTGTIVEHHAAYVNSPTKLYNYLRYSFEGICQKWQKLAPDSTFQGALVWPFPNSYSKKIVLKSRQVDEKRTNQWQVIELKQINQYQTIEL